MPEPAVEIRRSTRRRRTVSAYRDGDRTVVLVPASLRAAEERRLVAEVLAKLAAREQRRRPDDVALGARAALLAHRYLPQAPAPASVRWVDNQHSRWGSCTVADRTIRISSRVAAMPPWVLDYVLVHELAHLVVAGHGPAFTAIVASYPQAERARGFLEGYAAAGSGAPDAD